jgi:5-methylcytosine-specific restriction endonuclease McrA
MARPRLRVADIGCVPTQVRPNHSFYQGPEWRALTRRILAERGRRCERCGTTEGRITCDHIQELADGGAPLDPANVEIMCNSCHGFKTAAARRARVER